MHEALQSAAESQLFLATAAPYLLLDTDLLIQAANPAYLRATGRDLEELAGTYMFDAFPDNPEDASANGVHNLGLSLERVLRHGTTDYMGVQRYDIPDPRNPGTYRQKTWTPINAPLTDADQNVVGILHHVEDITAVQDIVREAGGGDLLDGQRQPASVVRQAMLAAARSTQALAAIRTGIPALNGSTAQDVARRDVLWHRITHAARRNADGGCAAAICVAATQELAGINAAAITVSSTSLARHQLGATDTWAQRVEELQLITGEGPSITAFESGQPALVPDLDDAAATWPAYIDAARGIGLVAVFAFPLRSATAVLGTLSLYQRRSSEYASAAALLDMLADAELFADIAVPVLLADVSSELVDQISTAAAEDDINVAIGILAAAEQITTEDARARLRAAAYASGRRLVDVAREVLIRHMHRRRDLR